MPFDAVTITLNAAIDQTLSVPNFTKGAVNRAVHVQSTPGGKGVNVAAALADYGFHVTATGFLGAKNTSPFEALFAARGITDAFVRLPGQTRTGIKIVDSLRNQTTDINAPGISPTAVDLDRLRERLASLNSRWFVIAGSLPPGVDPAFYRELVTLGKEAGGKVAVDTSGEALLAAIEAKPNLIKPNIYELEALTGETLDGESAIKAAKALLQRGIELVTVSMGQEGACFVSTDGMVIARPPSAPVSSTVGAGDAMLAGIIAGHLRGMALQDTARLATAFAVDALGKIGPGLSSKEAVDGWRSRVTIS